ncbi:MAG TPA: energy transducer TonB [Terriglobales bacterium]|nr:energy transducer TonB [Terriglobales bacterium]
MTRAWITGLVLMAGVPLQVKHPSACDHAAPPAGMRWECASDNSCDCRLTPNGAQGEEGVGEPKPVPHKTAAQCLACRITSFVIPGYPEEARRARKEGVVSAMLVLAADGSVQDVRGQSGDQELTSVAEAAWRQWRFSPGNREESIPVSIKFVLSENQTGSVTGTSLLNTVVTASPAR